MNEEKQSQLAELIDELEIILSVKNDISTEEIDNFTKKFNLLSEYDIRNKICEITKDDSYINNIDNTQEFKLPDEPEYNEYVNNDRLDELNEYKNLKDNSCEHIKDDDKVLHNDYKWNVNEDFVSEDKKELNKTIEEVNSNKIYSFDEQNIPEVSFIRGETKYGQLSLEWGWPEEIDEVLICYRMDRFPTGPKDLSATQYEIKRCAHEKIGSYSISKVSEGDFYFCVYTKVNLNGKVCYSQGQKRLVVNKEPSEIFYEIKIKRSIFGKLKSSEIIVWTKEKEMNLPQLILVGKVGNMPLQKSDGEIILNIDYEVIKKDECINMELPNDIVRGNMYVKLFFLDDANSKLFRIVSPGKERLYFK
ncbi:hypothetical protein BD780_001319 [Clostridium tetanomorphum]|uniref:Uncharacterized protein n=1 Tax=Clostridium tetanomorphum TaxID=1553 RepID=A0A923ECR2_CLOTT|nr:hypothetical protein [Clostridium tetanomorphum]KAJ53569.1 hypothetical protein CTM_01759 [Clostridium tetanomorphum DSM 665]MBC2398058.1 hypothetical protein [Clostridium tetanomorphum]MBP1864624.1 hypothetical protein [Clostridium tetanomorphum]NRS84094.1 hypothetical protein [Clostridium tetanomorphum]NRZ97307.1 hypothetical protein [Clostridium tetanomorphum]